jgi:hypothetical protein
VRGDGGEEKEGGGRDSEWKGCADRHEWPLSLAGKSVS